MRGKDIVFLIKLINKYREYSRYNDTWRFEYDRQRFFSKIDRNFERAYKILESEFEFNYKLKEVLEEVE